MTAKESAFCEEYLIDLNATQAAIRAGYSKKTANRIAAQLLSKLDIQAKLEELKAARAERTEVTADQVVRELAYVAFARMDNFAEVKTVEHNGKKFQTVTFKPTDEVPEDHRAALMSLKEGQHGMELKLHDKVKALELLGKHVGIFEKDNNQKKPEAQPLTAQQFGEMVAALNKK